MFVAAPVIHVRGEVEMRAGWSYSYVPAAAASLSKSALSTAALLNKASFFTIINDVSEVT